MISQIIHLISYLSPYFYYLTQTSTVKTKQFGKIHCFGKILIHRLIHWLLKMAAKYQQSSVTHRQKLPFFWLHIMIKTHRVPRRQFLFVLFLGFFVHFVQRETHSINTFCPPLPRHIGLSPVTWNMSIKCKIMSALKHQSLNFQIRSRIVSHTLPYTINLHEDCCPFLEYDLKWKRGAHLIEKRLKILDQKYFDYFFEYFFYPLHCQLQHFCHLQKGCEILLTEQK